MIRVMFALCLLAAGCGAGEVPGGGPPAQAPQRQGPVSLPTDDDFRLPCDGFVRIGPFSADLENIDEVRSFLRVCDEVRSLASLPSCSSEDPLLDVCEEVLSFSGERRATMCPEFDSNCVNIYRGGRLVNTLDGSRFGDSFSPRSFGRPLRLDQDTHFVTACGDARSVERRCY